MRRLERRRDSLMKESSSGGSRRAASSRETRGGRASPLRSATRSKNSPIFVGPSSLALYTPRARRFERGDEDAGEIVGMDVIGVDVLLRPKGRSTTLQALERQTIGGID